MNESWILKSNTIRVVDASNHDRDGPDGYCGMILDNCKSGLWNTNIELGAPNTDNERPILFLDTYHHNYPFFDESIKNCEFSYIGSGMVLVVDDDLFPQTSNIYDRIYKETPDITRVEDTERSYDKVWENNAAIIEYYGDQVGVAAICGSLVVDMVWKFQYFRNESKELIGMRISLWDEDDEDPDWIDFDNKYYEEHPDEERS